MLDIRTGLPEGTVLRFQGLSCELGKEIGRGSNALVYEGSYQDALEKDRFHRVLVKELFPLDVRKRIFRKEDGSIWVDPASEAVFQMNRESFEAGNRAHLSLLEKYPDQIGANLNTFKLNGTLYSVLGASGGNTLAAVQRTPARSLRVCAARLLAVLDALEVFHEDGLAHLDIAPDNILLLGKGNRERVLLTDFNSVMDVRMLRQEESPLLSIKYGYTAPEIRMGKIKEIGFPADLYSVTAVFYRMITGSALTSFQMIRALPPDVSDCPCLKDEPDTVKAWVQEILRRGLQTLPSRRYKSAALMRRDIEELIDRIDGNGIMHWALWEAGRRQVGRMVRENPSLSFLADSAALFPAMVTDGKEVFPVEEKLQKTRESCLLLGGGGMGKTTSLLHIIFSQRGRYSPDRPAMLYLSLYGWRAEKSSYIMDSILDGLHYRPQTHTYDDARKALQELLDNPSGMTENEKPLLLLLLDGLNEVADDPGPLLEEIKRLSSFRGIRLVVAGRTDEEALPFPRLRMAELTEKAVEDVLSKVGMLLPESSEMQKLLRTPMMLSMYIQSGRMEKKQIRAGSSDELLKTYLLALEEKAVRDLSEQTDRRWQIDAAMKLALPSIASEINRKRRGLYDSELYPVAEKCYRLLNGPLSRRFFPQWIGRSAAIRGSAKNAEEWYGQIAHDILWKQLGLIVRNEQGRYTVSHQVIEEYLLKLDKENRRKIQSYHRIRILLFCIILGIMAASSYVVYQTYIAPRPYNEKDSDSVMELALGAFERAWEQNKQLSELNHCAVNSPDDFEEKLSKYKENLISGISAEVPLNYLTAMLDTGEVMPWSGKPMEEHECRELLSLSSNREEEYQTFSAVLEYVMTDQNANKWYGKTYPELLGKLLKTDAQINAKLYQIACLPHVKGKYADHSTAAESYRQLLSSVDDQDDFLSEEEPEISLVKLSKLQDTREEQLNELKRTGAFYAFRQFQNSERVSQKGAAETASEAFLKEDSPEARMTNDLVGYVCVSETLCANVLWVLDAFDQFDKDRKWENLQLARAALSIARLNNDALRFPEMKMTVSDYSALMDRGVDVSFLEEGQKSFKADQAYYKNSCINLQYAIMDDVFIEEDWLLCMESGKIYRDMIESETQYLANTVDWVLSSLGNDSISAKIYDVMEKNCPLTHAKQASVLRSPEKIEEETAVLLNHIEEFKSDISDVIGARRHRLDISDVIGARRHRLNIMKEYLEKGDYAVIGAGLMEISGLPLVIPYPAWYDEQIDYYYWKENGEVTALPAPGTVLERIPDTFLTKSSGVTREDVLEYQDELEEAGLTCSGSTDKDGKLFLLYEYGESVFSISWEKNEASIFMTENPICLAPVWYLPAKNAVN